MAGLVDYVVDSEKESDDEKLRYPAVKGTRQTSENGNRSSPAKPSSKGELNESRKQSSKEVQESDGKETKRREHRHKHRKRSRSRSRDRKRDREKERDKDRSRDRRDRRRSRSRSRDRKSHKHERNRHRHRSNSKSRSRSPSRDKHHKSSRRGRSQERHEKTTTQPIADTLVDQPRATSSSLIQAAAQQVEQSTVPSFYNPNTVNASRVAQQMQKRKLLWSHKEKEPTATTAAKLWESTAFSQDEDGKMTAKFKRLMGIKGDAAASEKAAADGPSEVLKKQKELFASLDQQYAVARAATHTQRGLGLGFSSNPR